MSKRKRTSSVASRQEDDSLDSNEASTSSTGGYYLKKRKKHFDPIEVCHQLYDTIRNYKKSDGALLCDSFIRVPKRRQEPGYYDVVTNPIDLLKVQQKLKTDEYEDIHDLETDIELIVSNTKAFYKKSTQEWKDADELWNLFIDTKERILRRLLSSDDDVKPESNKLDNNRRSMQMSLRHPPRYYNKNSIKRTNCITRNHSNYSSNNSLNDLDSSSVSHNGEESNQYEELFNFVMTATDDSKKLLHSHFQLLPSKKKFPDYYEVVEQPIDLKRIAIKIQNKEYQNVLNLASDLIIMCKNACLYYVGDVEICNHAKALKKIINEKINEMMSPTSKVSRASPVQNKTSERLFKKRNKNYIASMAQLKDEDTDDDLEETEIVETENQDDFECPEPNNPQWKLFETVTKLEDPSGTPLSNPFWKLPSKRFYPDYYREIKNPVSLTQIRRKLLNREYGTLSEVAGDLTIMFENAKKYNMSSSKIYKDAVKLQKVMQNRVQELLDIDQQNTYLDFDLPFKKKIATKPKNISPLGTPFRGRPPKDFVPLRKRLQNLATYMLKFTCDGRQPMLAFMEKPSKKLYADYYEVIAEPIDFLGIEAKIKADQYSCEKDLVKDFKLMFSNCRQFNEENSTIYEDANLLEKHLMDKIGPLLVSSAEKERKERNAHHSAPPLRVYKPRKIMSALDKALKSLFDAVKYYKDPKGDRNLCQIFMKLPSRMEYPDYYEVIKHPIDMERIANKMKNNFYESIDDLAVDLSLMLDNASKFNEPDSQIYKDALVLQQIVSRRRLELKEQGDDEAPDVAEAVQDLLLTLFTKVYNHQDDVGRCYSDSMTELPEYDEIDGKKIRGLSLDLIKRRLDKRLYKRLDKFQADFFAFLDRARKLSRSDSQIFEDSVEMQMYFINLRDELCQQGGLFQSPALSYGILDARHSIEKLRHEKSLNETIEEETETRSSDDSVIKDIGTNGPTEETMTCNEKIFLIGEFVYLDAKDKNGEPHILKIIRLFEKNGQQMLYGNYYLRPDETYHAPSRRFLEKEVFKSDQHTYIPLDEIKERCCIVPVKQYFTMKPEGFNEKDIYVLESRYNSRQRSFKKIKIFPDLAASIKLVPREIPLEPKRVMSVFRERLEKHKDELAELQDLERMIDDDRPNVIANVSMELDDGNTYYEQYNTFCSGVVKIGDFVYVVVDGGRQVIAQIDSIWETQDPKHRKISLVRQSVKRICMYLMYVFSGKCYFRGPWFIYPSEVPNPTNKLYYKNEILLSTEEDVNPIVSIIGKCSILDYDDYVSFRQTEIPESDVFICTSLYDEINRQMKKLPPGGLKKYYHLAEVVQDELYYFTKLLNPPKVNLKEEMNVKLKNSTDFIKEPSPTLSKLADVDIVMEDSLDGGPSSVGSGDLPIVVSNVNMTPSTQITNTTVTPAPPATTTTSTASTSKKKPTKNKVVTGYILYSREVRKRVVQNNPESTFGDISRIVGSEWKALPTTEKQIWEERASKLNEENKAQLSLEQEQCPSPAPAPPPENMVKVYECKWEDCDFQFEELSDCVEHVVKDSKESQGHVQAYCQEHSGEELNCKWRNCSRHTKKNLQPFPNMTRLIRHVRDMHINKGNGRVILPENRSKNFKPSTKIAALSRLAATTSSAVTNTASTPASTSAGLSTTQKMADPMFISVPPRPQRVLHSEAYIKYIEKLSTDHKHISNWERTLHATPETCPAPDPDKLAQVATWLGKRCDQHDNVVAALWQLRNQLLKDSLCLQKTL